ncbi:putative S-adenosyl-L-methionine-dependent methyltransferase [mine drainage metagenome]|uniref:Putative S-adenosyl-L-methionine-dependent methyltransferase n=1 Tax=mine drainage metagenome TaxID=410659 RepID=A0A1J5Q8T9_9ZZZZ
MDSSRTVSRTALTSAAARAAHLLIDHEPLIFVDSLARTLLGERADELIAYHQTFGSHPVLAGARTEVLCRSLFTESLLAESRLSQYVILGAGLDTYAYRARAGISVFEVDHPLSQAWKRHAIETAGITAHGGPTFVPVDLESDSLLDALVASGFDLARPAFVSLLGVSMYLTGSALTCVIAELASFAARSQVVVDYMLAPALRDDAGRAYAEAVGAAVAEDGEPWLSFYAPGDLTPMFLDRGFTSVRHVTLADSVDPGLWRRTDALAPMGLSGLLHATR